MDGLTDIISNVWEQGLFGIGITEIIVSVLIFITGAIARAFFVGSILKRVEKLTADTESEVITVRDCIDEAITLVSLDKRGKSIIYEVDCGPEIKIEGDSQRLLQVLLNLISNGRDASQPDSTIKLKCESIKDGVKIMIEDEGIGIPPAIRDRVFDPFFTTKITPVF